MGSFDYANIIIDISHEKVDKPFQYRIPDRLKGKLEVGMPVKIPFGRGDTVRKGYIIEFASEPNYDPLKIKEILDVSEDYGAAKDI